MDNLWRKNSSPALISMAVAVGGFAITLVILGIYGTVPRRPILWTSLVLCLEVAWLARIAARRSELGNHFGYLMMLFGVCYWFAIPAIPFGVQGERYVGDRYELTVTQKATTSACFSIALFHFASVLAYWASYGSFSRRAQRWPTTRPAAQFYMILIGLFLMGFLPFMLYGGTWREILTQLLHARAATPSWKSATGAIGDERSALYYLCVSGFVAAGGFAGTWAILSRDPMLRKTLIAMYLVAGAVVYLDGGTRSWIALAWLPAALAWIVVTLRHKITLFRIVACLLVIAAVQIVFETARAWRSVGFSWNRILTTDLSELHFDNDFFTDVAVSRDLVPHRHPYFGFGDVVAFVTHPIPRFLWKDKPISPVLLYYNEKVYHGFLQRRGNKLPSNIGQAHMCFGSFGVVTLGLLSGWLAALASVLMSSEGLERQHLGALLSIWWFLMARGIYPGWMYPLIFVLILVGIGFNRQEQKSTRRVQVPALANS